MKKIMPLIGLLSICLTMPVAHAKVIQCSYTSRVNALLGEHSVSDSLVIDTTVSGEKFGTPLLVRKMADGGILKVFSSGDDKNTIAISLRLGKAGTVSANSSDSSGNMKSSVHLDYVENKGFGTGVFTSVRCEFVN